MQSTQLRTPFLRVAQHESYQSRGPQTTSFFRSQEESQEQVARQNMADQTTLTYGPALAKLKMEADKIRKWKTATQFELKKKESQLSETRQQLRVAREDVTRVRVREEGLKTQLQDQLSSHTELQHKVLVTRGLCSTLKEKVGKVEGALDQGRADQDNNRDLDNLRLEQYRALTAKFRQLEQEQRRVHHSLEEALTNEREKGRGLEEELTNERAGSRRLCEEVERLQAELQTASSECDGVKVKMGEVEKRLGEEVRRRGCAEELCDQLQGQLEKARDDSLSLQKSILSLTQQISSQEADYKSAESRYQEQVREGEKIRGELEDRVHRVQTALQQHQTDLATAVRDKENLEISLTAVREELCAVEYSRRDDVVRLTGEMKEKEEAHFLETAALSSSLVSLQSSLSSLQTKLEESGERCAAGAQEIRTLKLSLTQSQTANTGLLSEVEELKKRATDLEREREERERERRENQNTVSLLRGQLETLQSQLEGTRKTEEERVSLLEREKSEVEKELFGVRKQFEEVEEERQRVKEEMEGVKRESGEEVRRWREEAERARDTQTREKESFDIQVTELCGMLERYRSENQKIVQQKELQIQSLQSSLASSGERKEEMEAEMRGREEEARGLREEVSRLQADLSQRDVDLRLRESQVREKDDEMAGLLKAVDTLRRKQQSACSSIPQSTTHTPRPSPSTLPPHTPLIPTMSGTTAPPMSAPVRPPLKKTRHCDEDEDDEEEGGVARYGHTDCEDILFRKPRPLVARSSHSSFRTPGSAGIPRPQKSGGTLTTGPPRSAGTPLGGGRDYCSSSVGEVSSTASSGTRSDRKRHTPSSSGSSRVVQGSGRGRKERRGEKGRGGRKPAAGTAWFDLDAVFGLGPED